MAVLKQERAVRTRAHIIRSAADVFDRLGFSGASISKIVKESGTTQGAIYFHFKSKEELAYEVMRAQPEVVVPQLGAEGLQRLVDTTLVWSRRLQEDVILRAGVRLATDPACVIAFDVTDSYGDWAGIFEECLIEARGRGELHDHVDPRQAAELLVGLLTGTQMYSEVVSGRADLPGRMVNAWRLLAPALAVPETVEALRADQERIAALCG
ncbi:MULTISPECIES: ScbR family autoregulator-binding transcription factor [Streptomyces]|uniref:TetR/AcrR family transcriptional regulator n=1 Tax=Streptomyces lichenis TaxID=2306967 RepID=A0ABT0I3W6_9ACTN|nr:ScbR family autoregulator-binding transcription factor [Streptomyces lichenis]MCK8676008.1 TetR/AcrR family transcriptional regulator [Streptomyces lichenis]